jgi:hypothetical protein
MVLLLTAVAAGAPALAGDETGDEPPTDIAITTEAGSETAPDDTDIPTETPIEGQPETPVPEETVVPPPEATEPPAATETATPPAEEPVPDDPTEVTSPVPTETPPIEAAPTEAIDQQPDSGSAIEIEKKKELSLTVRSKGADFGSVTPDGTINGGARGLTSSLVGDGADYVIPGAVTLKIKSDGDWTITCSIIDLGSWGGGSIGSLSWRVSGEEAWQPIPAGGVILSGSAGTTTIELDLRLHVSWTDAPGAVNAVMTYQAAALPDA